MAGAIAETVSGTVTNGTTITTTAFATTPSSGEWLVSFLHVGGDIHPPAQPGWNRIAYQQGADGSDLYVYTQKVKAGNTATTYTFTWTGSAGASCRVSRVTGLHADMAWDVWAGGGTTGVGTATSASTGTTAATTDTNSFVMVGVGVTEKTIATITWTTATADGQTSNAGTGATESTIATGSFSSTSAAALTDTAAWASGGAKRCAAIIVAFRETAGSAASTDAFRDAVMAKTPSEYVRMRSADVINGRIINHAVGGTGADVLGSPAFEASLTDITNATGAMTLDGTDDELRTDMGTNTGILTYTGTATVQFVVRAAATAARADNDTLMRTLGSTAGDVSGLIAFMYGAANVYKLHWRDNVNGGWYQDLWTPTENDVDLVHIVTDATSMRIYRNGTLHTTITTNAQTAQYHGELAAGTNKNATAYFTGAIQEYAYFQTPLTGGDITTIYAAGFGVTGTAAVTLADSTSTASGAVTSSNVTGTAAVQLADATSAASGTFTPGPVTGTAAVTLDAATGTASGTSTPPNITGTVAVTLADATSTASGTSTPPGNTGTAAVTLADATAAASGTFTPGPITGTVAVTLADATSTASGAVTSPNVTGTAAVTLSDNTPAASGTSTPPPVTGTVSVTLAAATGNASGTSTPPAVTGTVVVTLADNTSNASGTFTAGTVTGTASITLDDFTAAASGTFTPASITGTAAVTLADHTSTGTGTSSVPLGYRYETGTSTTGTIETGKSASSLIETSSASTGRITQG